MHVYTVGMYIANIRLGYPLGRQIIRSHDTWQTPDPKPSVPVDRVQAGFNSGDGVTYYTLPGSMTSSVLGLERSSNVGLNGRWMFRVDGPNVQLPNAAAWNAGITILRSVLARTKFQFDINNFHVSRVRD